MPAPPPLPPPKLQQKSLFVIPDSRGILGAAIRHETVLENQKLKQKFRHVEHDHYQQELPMLCREKRKSLPMLSEKRLKS
jgi:hypothetical protein